MRWLAKQPSPSDPSAQPTRLIVSTGERMADIVTRVYRSFGLRTTDYEPVHARGLGNEFYCYANFESDCWGWRDDAGVRQEGAGQKGKEGEDGGNEHTDGQKGAQKADGAR